jgi:putative endonuclease
MRGESALVYILTNRGRTLYVGVTTNLEQRLQEHKSGVVESSFTHRYRLDRLVYYEQFQSILSAIAREKKIKSSLRIKKIALIVSVNPDWRDLSKEWGKPIIAPATSQSSSS